MDTDELGVELAGGGLLWRDVGGYRELAVVHRPEYDDWTLPKGTLEPERDGSWTDCAVREVTEETGCDVELGEFAGSMSYLPERSTVKVVLFWHMELVTERPFDPDDETDELEWCSVSDALETLDYPRERDVVIEATDWPGTGGDRR